MSKRLSDIQKEEIVKGFMNGKSLYDLSEEFCCTKLTISRNLKKKFGDGEYKKLLKKNTEFEYHKRNVNNSYKKLKEEDAGPLFEDNNFSQNLTFTEIAPLNLEIDDESRKDFSSIPIDEIDLPKTVFMIVDKKIELEIKLLKEYPEWLFLPEDDLNKKTIKIYSELKDAKKFCKKDCKVIKVPNSNVFKIASRIILSKGISRIISDKQLIAL